MTVVHVFHAEVFPSRVIVPPPIVTNSHSTGEAHLVRTIIVDGEGRVRSCLEHMPGGFPEFRIIAEASTASEGIDLTRIHHPDLAIVNVSLGEKTGFDVLEALLPAERPEVIFVSSINDHAVRAFEIGAIDYVPTPCTTERFHQALERSRERLAHLVGPGFPNASVLHRGEGANGHDNGEFHLKDRLVVKSKDRITFVKLDDIDWIEAAADYVRVHASGKCYLIRAKIGDLEGRLDPQNFVRIHRSAIVRLDRISELRPLYHGEFQVVLKDNTELTLSRGYRGKFSRHLVNPV